MTLGLRESSITCAFVWENIKTLGSEIIEVYSVKVGVYIVISF